MKGQRWQLSQTIVLGRETSCDVVVADRQISRFHARITPTTEGVILEDLGSKNGTHLNGVPLTAPVVLSGWGSRLCGDGAAVPIPDLRCNDALAGGVWPGRPFDDGSEVAARLGEPAAARPTSFCTTVQAALVVIREPRAGRQPPRSGFRGLGG